MSFKSGAKYRLGAISRGVTLGATLLSVAVLSAALLCTSCGGKTADSPEAGSLLSLLAGIPQDPISQADDFVYFTDYSAMESAYGATRPADAEEFAALPADAPHNVWWVLFRGSAWIFGGPYWQVMLEDGPDTVGFSPLQVDQAIQFGAPPGDGLMLAGSFDAGAISAAYQANVDLTPKDFDGATVLLWGEDPEDGFLVDTSSVMRENPFGGYLGRRQPMIVGDDLLMSSADLDLVLAHVDAMAGETPSLADAPGYQAAVNAVAEDADILQAAVSGPVMVQQIMATPLSGDLLPAETDGPTSVVSSGDSRELPAYELLILADVASSDEQIARLGLVFADAGSAETAGAVLLDRLASYQPIGAGRSLEELLADRNVTDPRCHVQESSDLAVLVLEFPTPKATTAEIVQMVDMAYDGAATPPGLIYRLFLNMFAQRDTGWLSAGGSD